MASRSRQQNWQAWAVAAILIVTAAMTISWSWLNEMDNDWPLPSTSSSPFADTADGEVGDGSKLRAAREGKNVKKNDLSYGEEKNPGNTPDETDDEGLDDDVAPGEPLIDSEPDSPIDFLIIGTQKGGTSSAYHLLKEHPMISSATTKELHFFDKHYHRGLAWYRKQLPRRQGTVIGEATPYYMLSKQVARRVAAVAPRVRLVVLLRNPTDRAWSHYQMAVRNGAPDNKFEQKIDRELEQLRNGSRPKGTGLISRGFYLRQLENWWQYFPREQFLLLRSEDFFAHPHQVLNRIVAFLDLPPFDGWSEEKRNAWPHESLPPELRPRLDKIFHAENERLRQHTGISWP